MPLNGRPDGYIYKVSEQNMKKLALLISLVALFVLLVATFKSRGTAAHTASADAEPTRSATRTKLLLARFQAKFPAVSAAGFSLWPAEIAAYQHRHAPRQLTDAARLEGGRNNDPDLGPEADGFC